MRAVELIEESFLGGCIHAQSEIPGLIGLVDPDDFEVELNGFLWQTIIRLHTAGQVTVALLLQSWRSNPDQDQANAEAILTSILRSASPATADSARAIRNAANSRRLVRATEEVAAEAASDLLIDAENLMMSAEKRFAGALKMDQHSARVAPFSEQSDDALAMFEARYNGEVPAGLTTGLPKLDEIMGPMEPGNYYVVGGRPGMGKSIFTTHVAKSVAERGVGVANFNLEMPQAETHARMIANELYRHPHAVSYGKIKRGEMNPDQMEAVREASKRVRELPIYNSDRMGLTPDQIAAESRKQQKIMAADGVQLGLVVVDYLQLLTGDQQYSSNAVYMEGQKSLAMKSMAKALGVPVLVTSQLSRSVEGRDDKRPILADLRNSGQIEQDASVVLFCYRHEYYLKKCEPDEHRDADEWFRWNQERSRWQNTIELICAKNRDGDPGTAELKVNLGGSRIVDTSQ